MFDGKTKTKEKIDCFFVFVFLFFFLRCCLVVKRLLVVLGFSGVVSGFLVSL